MHFNSIKVRLELGDIKGKGVSLNQFQFHKGTIRTVWKLENRDEKREFQFHKGTIRTF